MSIQTNANTVLEKIVQSTVYDSRVIDEDLVRSGFQKSQIQPIYAFIKNALPGKIDINGISGISNIYILQGKKPDVVKFFDAGGLDKFNNYDEYLVFIAAEKELETQRANTADKSNRLNIKFAPWLLIIGILTIAIGVCDKCSSKKSKEIPEKAQTPSIHILPNKDTASKKDSSADATKKKK